MRFAGSIAAPRQKAFPRQQAGASAGFVWWGCLLVAITLEGLGRRLLPLPAPVLYFSKDALLVIGILLISRHTSALTAGDRFARPLPILVGATALWCGLTLAFPDHPSLLLGLLGMRQYLLWWFAPLVVASAIVREGESGRVERLLTVLAIAVAGLAAYQFTQPPTEAINAYAWDTASGAVATVSSTGRVRVSSTFSYISGFSNFVSLITPLLLAMGASSTTRWARAAYVAAGALAATAPMSGGRAAVLYVAMGAFAVVGMSGGFSSRRGALGLGALVLAVGVGLAVAPEAAQGVGDRFDSEETGQRFRDLASAVPVVPILGSDYPPLGLGVGAMQNAGAWLGIETGWRAESEPHRLLIEVGVPGYLLVWLSRFVLALALVRAGRDLARGQARPWAGVAWTYAALCMLMPLTIDHVAQALFFSGVGLVLARVVQFGAAAPAGRRKTRR